MYLVPWRKNAQYNGSSETSSTIWQGSILDISCVGELRNYFNFVTERELGDMSFTPNHFLIIQSLESWSGIVH